MIGTILLNIGLAGALAYLTLLYPSLRQTIKLRAHRSRLPPGPKAGKTGIAKPWVYFRQLSAQYGDVVYVPGLSSAGPTVVLGSARAAWDLLERRGAVYSSRPRFVVGGELLSDGLRGLMAPYGDFWRRWRKLLHSGFMQRRSASYRPIQRLESAVLARDILADPGGFRAHVERYAASVIMLVTYGRRVVDVARDEVVKQNIEAMGRLTSVNIPGKYAAERYPALKYIPAMFAPWKAEDKVARGVATPCFTTHLLEEQEALGMSDLELAYTAGSPFGAGIETTAGTLASFFLACVKFGHNFIPRAQEELDRVVGRDRLPTFEDMEELEYVRAIASETFRWRPVAVLGGTPHASTADDMYNGMFIPKGSTIIAPLWTIHLNERDFPEPHEFKPERFLEDRDFPGTLGHSAFGWGRRICPGMHLGAASVNLNIARTLWAFNVTPAKDETGQDIDVDIFAFTDGFNSSPLPFPCSILPRSPQHADVVRRTYEEAVAELKTFKDSPVEV
ncbi:Cytochrome P450 monooxygenase COX2 [Apiospora phragmitis]|uniref:Cytochrome P450 monooxygenase COX2 n=1 Tax=Apiospora phragmitis TaxID=2905665 RepID=A0ABR1T2I9_9PEZI